MDLLLDLAAAPGATLRRRAEHALREGVRCGRLAPGQRLPSTRALAVQLGVSRGVVAEAYAQLAAEGYLVTRRGGGTSVAAGGGPALPRSGAGTSVAAGDGPAVPRSGSGTSAAGSAGEAVPRRGAGAADAAAMERGAGVARGPAVGEGAVAGAQRAAGPMRHDLRPALPALSGFPRAAWLAASGRVLRALPDERLGYPDPGGTPELRATLAAYLGRVRGVRATPDQIVVTNGLRDGLELLWSQLAGQGVRRVALEHPGWRGWAQTAQAAGLEIARLAVDADGVVLDGLVGRGGAADGTGGPQGASGAAVAAGAAGGLGRPGEAAAVGGPDGLSVGAVGVTPAHQFPTGAVLSPARRAALVAWAQRGGGLVVEDDYDAEFRYDRKPVGSLQGLAPDVVVYAGTASKILAPVLRLGWLVLPPPLVAPLRAALIARGGAPAPLEQLVLADLIERGELDRHLRRQRRRYRRQRDALLTALARELPEVAVEGVAAGLHALLRLPGGSDEQAVLAAAAARGVALDGLGHGGPGLVVGYANVGEAAIPAAVTALADAVRAATGRSSPDGPRTARAGTGRGRPR